MINDGTISMQITCVPCGPISMGIQECAIMQETDQKCNICHYHTCTDIQASGKDTKRERLHQLEMGTLVELGSIMKWMIGNYVNCIMQHH